MTVYSLGGMTSLGSVINESSTKDAGLFQQPLPASNSNQAILLDIFGSFRTIIIDGIFVDGQDGVSLATFISQLDALVNGSQISVSFVSGKSTSTYQVLVQSITWKSEEGSPTKVNYTINMAEGSL
jgi:hypothetical protein